MYLLPLVGTLFSGLFSGTMVSRYYGQRGSSILNIFCMAIAFISSVMIWYEVVFGACEVYIDVFGPWFSVGSFNVCWSLYYDLIAVHLLITVTSVSFAVHCYALVYMKSDPHLNQFMCYLSLFTFFMCVLVTGQDLIVMLIGWEGIQHQCLNDGVLMCLWYQPFGVVFKKHPKYRNDSNHRFFYKPKLPTTSRRGPHTSLFKQIMVGFLLGDGWLELHGQGARLGISLTEKFKDVVDYYKLLLYGMGYVTTPDTGRLIRSNRPTTKPYYQFRTFTFSSLIPYFHKWYKEGGPGSTLKYIKVIPDDITEHLTPLALGDQRSRVVVDHHFG